MKSFVRVKKKGIAKRDEKKEKKSIDRKTDREEVLTNSEKERNDCQRIRKGKVK